MIDLDEYYWGASIWYFHNAVKDIKLTGKKISFYNL